MGDMAVMPGQTGTRDKLVNEINLAFNRVNIHATLNRLGNLASTGDFLDICDALGFLKSIDGGNFAQYKQKLTIPQVNQQLLTAAFRASLTASPDPIPLQILISSGSYDIVTVTTTATEVSVVIVRADLPMKTPRKQAPRKSAPRKR